MLSERSQTQKATYYTIPFIWKSRIVKFIETKSGYQELRRGGKGELLFNGYRIPFWDDEKVLEMDSGNDCKTVNVLNAIKLCT